MYQVSVYVFEWQAHALCTYLTERPPLYTLNVYRKLTCMHIVKKLFSLGYTLPCAGVLRRWGALWVADGGSPSWGDSEGLCWIIQNNAPWTNSTQQLLLWGSLRRLTPQTAKGDALRSYRGRVVVQRRADLSASSGCCFEIMLCWGSLGSYRYPRVIAWLLPTCSGHVCWVASLFPPCLGVGRTLERLLQEWWVRLGFPVDTERTAARDYGFPVGLENPAWALLCPVWLCGVVWLLCLCSWSPVQAGRSFQVVSYGDCTIFWWASQCRDE